MQLSRQHKLCTYYKVRMGEERGMSENVIDLWKDEITDAEKNNAKDKRSYRLIIINCFMLTFANLVLE